MLIGKPATIKSSEITPKSTYLNRRNFLAGATIAGAAALTVTHGSASPIRVPYSHLHASLSRPDDTGHGVTEDIERN